MYLHMYARMCGCMRALVACIPACVRAVGAQVRVQHRARGAAGGGRLAEPEKTVSAPAAALTPGAPMRRRMGGRVVSARTRRARLGTCVRA